MSGPIPPGERFCTTQWSIVSNAKFGEPADVSQALQHLCEGYWPPVYAFLRRRGYGPHDAEDHTQGFFAHILQGNFLRYVERDQGRFRNFLLSALLNYLKNDWHRSQAQRRGGGLSIISFSDFETVEREMCGMKEQLTAEQAFDRKWALATLERAMLELEKVAAAAGKSEVFKDLKPYLSQTPTEGYQVLAEKHGISQNGIKMMVHRMRRQYGAVVRRLVKETLLDPNDLDAEIKHLLDLCTE